jgi:hypothetical protein
MPNDAAVSDCPAQIWIGELDARQFGVAEHFRRRGGGLGVSELRRNRKYRETKRQQA